jgi:superfamily II DNA/RNA helicase
MTEFSKLGLSPDTLRAVADAGYTEATPIQSQAIPVALTGRDVLGIAQTGTGKTAAFTLPMIDRLAAGRSKARMPRSLVIAPTRELADQVASSFEKYATHQKLSWALLIGGVSFEDQLRKLDRGVDVLIATPGRLLDHFERGKLLLTGVQMMVVDEADRMLDMGFIPDLERIFKLTPPNKQTLFFSATMPPEITRLTSQFLKDPTRIEVSRPATTGENITQYVTHVPSSEPKAKRMALRALIEKAAPESGIVFCNRKTDVDIVAKSLKKHGFDAAPIHGDLDQTQRMRTLDAFRKGELKLLVASDVAARGLDIPAVSHVFNYDAPHHADDYVHRIGRTGRAGRTGEAFLIVSSNDSRNYDKVLKLTKKEPQEMPLSLDWSEAEGDSERRRSRERSGERKPRGRDRDRERPRKDHGERASMEPLVATERPAGSATPEPPPPAAQETQSAGRRPERARRSEVRPSAEPEARQEPKARPPRAERPVRGVREPAARDDDDRGPKIVGFGADMPAFLMRAPRSNSNN